MKGRFMQSFLVWMAAGFFMAGGAQGQTKPTGTVTVAAGSLESQAWLPYLGATITMLQMVSGVYESLLQMGPNSKELRPMLAEKWAMSPDGKTYDFFLRKGVPFHGAWGELSSEDVKFSLEHTMAEGSKATRAGQFRRMIARVETVSPTHVRVGLRAPSPEWLWMMSTWLQDLPIICKKYVTTVGAEKAGAHPIGTGPYKFLEQKIGDYIKLEALDAHWRVVPYYRNIVIRVVPEARSALAMVQKREADLAPIPLTMLKEAKAGGVKILRIPDCGQMLMHFGGMHIPEQAKDKYDPTCPWVPFNDEKARKVRLALEMAIDKEAIRERILSGYAKAQVQGGFANDSTWSAPSWKVIPYDPKGARDLLAEAGYPKGFKKPIIMWQMIMPGREQVADVAEAVAQYWERNLGLKVDRRIIEYGPVKAAWQNRSEAWICYSYQWQGPYPEPYMLATRSGMTTTTFSVFGMDPRIDGLCKAIDAEPDFNKRIPLNREIGQIWYEKRSTIPIGFVDSIYAVSDKVGHWDLAPGIALIHNLEYLKP